MALLTNLVEPIAGLSWMRTSGLFRDVTLRVQLLPAVRTYAPGEIDDPYLSSWKHISLLCTFFFRLGAPVVPTRQRETC